MSLWLFSVGMLWAVLEPGDQNAHRMYEVSCFADQSIVGATDRGHLVIRNGSTWQRSSLTALPLRLWHSPDDRIFIAEPGPNIIELPHGTRSAARWALPPDSAIPLLTFLDGVVAVTPERIFRLDPGGKITDIGETPADAWARRAHRAPVLIGAAGRLVTCYGTSFREEDDMQGECAAPPPNSYHYLADFGGPEALAQGQLVAPFACGVSIISVRRGVTQARDLATGARLGHTAGAARKGSGCLDRERAVLIGKRDIRIVDVPRLRTLWRRTLDGPIATAAVCGTKLATILEGSSDPVLVDLPHFAVGKASVVPGQARRH